MQFKTDARIKIMTTAKAHDIKMREGFREFVGGKFVYAHGDEVVTKGLLYSRLHAGAL
jgi:hypothetical protein